MTGARASRVERIFAISDEWSCKCKLNRLWVGGLCDVFAGVVGGWTMLCSAVVSVRGDMRGWVFFLDGKCECEGCGGRWGDEKGDIYGGWGERKEGREAVMHCEGRGKFMRTHCWLFVCGDTARVRGLVPD